MDTFLESPWILLYFAGCVAAMIATVVSALVGKAIGWATKANNVARNIRKIQAPDDSPLMAKALKRVGAFAFEVLLSWISVAVSLWGLLRLIFLSMREALASTPESVKKLQFPLKNNLSLPAESVWAHVMALAALVGQPITKPSDLLTAFRDAVKHPGAFDRTLALRQLQSLAVVDREIVSQALTQVQAESGTSPVPCPFCEAPLTMPSLGECSSCDGTW